MQSLKIGKIIRIEGLKILIEITEEEIASKISTNMGLNDYIVSINKLVCTDLPSGKKIIGRISRIYDKNLFQNESLFSKTSEKYIFECDIVGIYDAFMDTFDTGINTFPIIGGEVYSISRRIQQCVYKIGSAYQLEIGRSYNNDLSVYANPDILFGKHLGIFGNTGTGKTCSIAAIIQGIKRRLKNKKGESQSITPKIIIFDTNSEYRRAFPESEFKVKVYGRNDIFLPHYYLNFSEYFKLLGASQGVQAPTLKTAIKTLREDNGGGLKFTFAGLPDAILQHIEQKANESGDRGRGFAFNQWYGWNSTLINRIEKLIEDDRIIDIIDTDTNSVEEMLSNDAEIIIIESDFDKDELDIIMFLFSKLLYQNAVNSRDSKDRKHILVLLEEAHQYINENDKDEYKLGHYYIERLAKEGRKFGISMIVSSQRPSELTQSIISQCNSFIIHKITNKRDLEFISKVLSSNNQDLINLISGLEQQHGLAIGEAFGYSDIIKIADACPTPKSDDPKVVENWSMKKGVKKIKPTKAKVGNLAKKESAAAQE